MNPIVLLPAIYRLLGRLDSNFRMLTGFIEEKIKIQTNGDILVSKQLRKFLHLILHIIPTLLMKRILSTKNAYVDEIVLYNLFNI